MSFPPPKRTRQSIPFSHRQTTQSFFPWTHSFCSAIGISFFVYQRHGGGVVVGDGFIHAVFVIVARIITFFWSCRLDDVERVGAEDVCSSHARSFTERHFRCRCWLRAEIRRAKLLHGFFQRHWFDCHRNGWEAKTNAARKHAIVKPATKCVRARPAKNRSHQPSFAASIVIPIALTVIPRNPIPVIAAKKAIR